MKPTHKKKIFLAGGGGFVGKALAARLRGMGYDVRAPRSKDYDLTLLEDCIRATRGVDLIVHSAGIATSREDQKKRPAEIFYTNTLITLQLLEAAKRNGVPEVLMVGSITGYAPHAAPQKEEYLLSNTAPLITGSHGFYGLSRWFMVPAARAYAEQEGIKIRIAIFPNLYGPADKFDHAIPPLVPNVIKNIDRAIRGRKKQFNAGGNPGGNIDLLYIDDACDFLVLLIKRFGADPFRIVNAGSGRSYTLKEVVEHIASEAGFDGRIVWSDNKGSKPSFLDIREAHKYGWRPKTSLSEGIKNAVRWFIKSYEKR